MIEIKNLTKVYKTSFKQSTVALDNMTIKLPNTGMVFIVGKSGSGKSTLLNMLGTLDNITSGDIIVDGKSLANSKDYELQEYRSSYLGFIFQDFLLLNEFTVKENIALALNISGIEDLSLIDEALERVDLSDVKDKLPTELSGGQKQRVAIARALVKNPKMLLCDEPTGNLDFKTSSLILKFLKEESKHKLVVIVSHNTEDAENFADRIIELHEGKVIFDISKNPNYTNEYQEIDNTVILPHHKDLTHKEVDRLNELIKTSKPTITQNPGGFIETKEIFDEPKEFKLQSSHLSGKNSLKLSKMFLRKNKCGIPYTVFMLMLFISLLYIFQVFVMFNGNNAIVKPQDDEALRVGKISEFTNQGTLSTSYIMPITQSEINKYYEAGYSGNIYQVYNYGFNMGTNYIIQNRVNRLSILFRYNYARETTGTICCDEEFLQNIYGTNGELKVICGSLDNASKKLIITDYTADCIIRSTSKGLSTYEDVYDGYKKYICAIIDTGYKERYKEVFEHEILAKEQGKSSDEYINQYYNDEQHISFLQEVQDYLALCYTYAKPEDFYTNVMVPSTKVTYVGNFYATDGKTTTFTDEIYSFYLNTTSLSLKDNEIVMSYSLYKELFGIEYNIATATTFKAHDVKISRYSNFTTDSELVFETTLKIVGLSDSNHVNKNTLKLLDTAAYIPYSLYFDNVSDKEIVYKVTDENGFLLYSLDTNIVPVINTIIELFRAFCYLIIILLIIVCIVYLIVYGINSIRRNLYEIGVLKALGSKSIDISRIFIAQIVGVGALVIIFSILGINVISTISNKMLISAFEEFMTIKIFNLSIIKATFSIMALDLSIVFVVTLVSSNIPLIYLKKVKPLNILKGKKK